MCEISKVVIIKFSTYKHNDKTFYNIMDKNYCLFIFTLLSFSIACEGLAITIEKTYFK